MTHLRIPLPALESLDQHTRAQLARRPPVHVYRMAAHAPGLIEPFMSLVQANFHALCLPAALREAVILRVGAHHRSAYEIHHHRVKAREAGLGEPCIDALLRLRPAAELPDPGLVDAIELADALLRERPIADALVRRLVASHGERGYVELALLIGFYRMVATFLEATGVTPEGESAASPPA